MPHKIKWNKKRKIIINIISDKETEGVHTPSPSSLPLPLPLTTKLTNKSESGVLGELELFIQGMGTWCTPDSGVSS
jgi:hypothetical protein